MFYAAKINPIVLILFLVLFMCVLILQIYLSNRKSPWPGLILPLLAFFWAVARMFMVRYFGMTAAEKASAYLNRFLIENLTTLILLFLYAACRVRNRRKKQKMLDKMNLHDLN